MNPFKNITQQSTPGWWLGNIIAVVLLCMLTFLLGSLYLGLPPSTPEEVRRFFFSRFFVLAVAVVPYMVLFTLINLLFFRRKIEHPWKPALLVALLDFAAVAVMYLVFLLATFSWEPVPDVGY